jgi:hypothetical protein
MTKPTEEAMKALDASIRKYQRTVKLLEGSYRKKIKRKDGEFYVSNHRIPYGDTDCPLCVLYYDLDCDGCCVEYDTEEDNCRKTPYSEYQMVLIQSNTVTRRLINSTKAERDYLVDLRKRLRVRKV